MMQAPPDVFRQKLIVWKRPLQFLDPSLVYSDAPKNVTIDSIKGCISCPRRRDYPRSLPVGPEGPVDAEFVFIGRDPGEWEAMTGRPFFPQAPGGNLFMKYLEALGLKRQDVYITNTCFCRGLANRPLDFSEAATCIKWKNLELSNNPKLRMVFPLGNDAYRACLGWNEPSILNIMDPYQFFSVSYLDHRVLVFPIQHPGLLLRNRSWIKYTFVTLLWIRKFFIERADEMHFMYSLEDPDQLSARLKEVSSV